MDRKNCVLFYSKVSPESTKLINHISQLPLDLPTIIGMSMVCVDDHEFKTVLQYNNIHHVPTIVIKYYDGSNQKLENISIYKWINLQIQSLRHEMPQSNEPEHLKLLHSATKTHIELQPNEKPDDSGFAALQSTSRKKTDITAIAMEMQKNRELDIVDQKPI
jgi:hypothetical protein